MATWVVAGLGAQRCRYRAGVSRASSRPVDAARQYVGGMNVPFAVGRVNATWPLATLTITHDTLRLAPRWFARMITTDFEVSLGHIRSAFPTRSRVFASGIGFELADGEVAYF